MNCRINVYSRVQICWPAAVPQGLASPPTLPLPPPPPPLLLLLLLLLLLQEGAND
jgi:hypothetical protein